MAYPGTIAITDFDWYRFLSQRRSWDEVNFWTPSAHWTFRAPDFSPFLFKLKAPHRAIAGFGYFARYSALPEWLAWDCFGQANGCASREEMHARLERIRRRANVGVRSGIQQIGCIVVVNATFFSRDEWIPQPMDWPDPNLRPMRYDLDLGEGARVWTECIARISDHELRVGPHEVRNGLLLRADLHRLFEQGYMTVTPNCTLEVSDRLRDDYQNGRSYYPLRGTRISIPTSDRERPTPDLLAWHNQNVFLQ